MRLKEIGFIKRIAEFGKDKLWDGNRKKFSRFASSARLNSKENRVDSWARCEEEKVRHARRYPLKELAEKTFQWKPKLERWGKGYTNTDGEFILPRKVIKKLRKHTKHNAREVQFLIDRNTGGVVDFQIGSKTCVHWNNDVYAQHTNLLIVHSHNDLTGPSGLDWFQALHQGHFQQFIVVGPKHIWELQRPVGWIRPSNVPFDVKEYSDLLFNTVYHAQIHQAPQHDDYIAFVSEVVTNLLHTQYQVHLLKTDVHEWAYYMRINRKRRLS